MARTLRPLDASLSEYQDRWDRFGAVLDVIEHRLTQLAPGTAWSIIGHSGAPIGIVTRNDFLRKFDNFSWQLTDKDYTAINGGVGQVLSEFKHDLWVSAAEEIRGDAFAIYLKHPEERGAIYLALHEVAHTTELGLQTDRLMQYKFHHSGNVGSWAASAEWQFNEQVANRIALTVANALDLPIIPHPTGGYDPIIREQYIA